MVFARLLFQNGAGNCKKGYWKVLGSTPDRRTPYLFFLSMHVSLTE